MSEYFPGERSITSFRLPLHHGKAVLAGTVFERWEPVWTRSLSCGNEQSRTLKRRFGVSRSDRADIEGTVQASLGLKGIAELKSELKSKIGYEIKWDHSRETEDSFKFEAPKCGRLTVSIYQLQRIYKLAFEDRRFWHRDRWTKTVEEWIDQVADQSKQIENDPSCGCERKPVDGSDGLVNLTLGNINMLVPFRRERGHIDFPSIGLSLRAHKVEQLFQRTYIIRRRHVPDYLLFLARANARTFVGRFTPYIAQREPGTAITESEHLWPRRLLYLLAGTGLGAIAGVLLGRFPRAYDAEDRLSLSQLVEGVRDVIGDVIKGAITRSDDLRQQTHARRSE